MMHCLVFMRLAQVYTLLQAVHSLKRGECKLAPGFQQLLLHQQ